YKIKLLAIAKKDGDRIEARVHPTMVPETHPIAKVDGVYNAVFVDGDAVGSTMFYGSGAGMMATASAVAADVLDISRNVLAGSVGRLKPLGYVEDAMKDVKIKDIDEVRCSYYLRFSVVDEPGVLSNISGALGKNNISISSVIQKGRGSGGSVPLVIVTHSAYEKELKAAIGEIEQMDAISEKIMIIRIEENNDEESE
ncbi:MAG: ACT domain-containing protein, partial [Deltaproteobacteria bacterium]|nr:ACT domain-containing protein [Deltaproteobacteria bacterium]